MKKDKKEKKEKKEKKQVPPAAGKESKPAQPAVPGGVADVDPLAYALTLVGGKWKLRILWALSLKPGRRYGDIKRDVPEITDMMLSQSLRELTGDGLIDRTQFQEIPPRVEYSLTPEGKSLLPILGDLREWAAPQITKSTTGNRTNGSN